jgi:hypothetical protein
MAAVANAMDGSIDVYDIYSVCRPCCALRTACESMHFCIEMITAGLLGLLLSQTR